mgnify:CR=1 FL=1
MNEKKDNIIGILSATIITTIFAIIHFAACLIIIPNLKPLFGNYSNILYCGIPASIIFVLFILVAERKFEAFITRNETNIAMGDW